MTSWQALMGRSFQISIVLLGSIVAGESRGGETSIDDLLQRCEKKMEVWSDDEQGQIVRIGERLGGFCDGYLQGFFNALVNSKTICPETNERITSEFLLSVVQTYRAEATNRSAEGSEILEAAFKRAFAC